MRIEDRRWHQRGGLATGIAEHHALVAGALVLVARGVDASRNVGRLPMDQAFDGGALPVKIFLLVADLANGGPRDLDQLLTGYRSRAADLAGQHHPVGGDQRLDPATGLRLGGKICVDDRIGDAVANFVGMTLRHRFARKYEITVGQGIAFPESVKKLQDSYSALMQSFIVKIKRDRSALRKPLSGRYFPESRSPPPASALASSNRRRRKAASSIL